MKPEYRFVIEFMAWMFLWILFPWVALPLCVLVVGWRFMSIRKARREEEEQEIEVLRERARQQLEERGQSEETVDPADWWKVPSKN